MPRPSRPQEELDDECRLVGELIRVQQKSYLEVAQILGTTYRNVHTLIRRYDQISAIHALNRSVEETYNNQLIKLQAIEREAWSLYYIQMQNNQSQASKTLDLIRRTVADENRLLGLTKDPQIAIVQNTEAIAERYWQKAEEMYLQLKSAQPLDSMDEGAE